MSFSPKILAFSGSTRKGSYNQKLLSLFVNEMKEYGANITHITLQDYSIPFYNGDLEENEGLPEAVIILKNLIEESDGIVIASPEYNGSISALLKNMIDWATRIKNSFFNSTALLVSASPSLFGGYRSLTHLRFILGSLGVHVYPGQKTLGQAHNLFDQDGSIRDIVIQEEISMLSKQFIDFTIRLQK